MASEISRTSAITVRPRYPALTLGNGLVKPYAYEATTGRLSTIKTGPNATSTIQDLEYDWDLAGNLEERVDQLLSPTEVFGYDALDRLTGVERNASTVYSVTYDALGNITSKTGVASAFNYNGSRPHAVSSIGSKNFVYDANGNTTSRRSEQLPIRRPVSGSKVARANIRQNS